MTLFEGGRPRGSDPCRDGGSAETSSQTDVRRTGTPLSGLEPQAETGKSVSPESPNWQIKTTDGPQNLLI